MAGLSLGGVSPTVLADDVSTRALDTVRVGELAGKLSAGSRNVFTGVGAGANVQASDVVLIGFEAGKNARQLSLAVFVGTRAGASADRSYETTLVGFAAGEAMRDCRQCVGIGAHVLREATAISSTAVGYRALERSLDADYNTAVGAEAMQNNRSGSFNTALGFQTMRAAFTCSECVMIGAYAGYSNATGSGMTVVGYKACEFLEAGEYSVALGAFALQYSSYSSNTVAIGASAGRGATASDAVLLGSRVASGAADVSGGVIIGESAASLYAGRRSVIVGANAGSNVIGDDNVLLGSRALSGGRASCSRTVAIGANVGGHVQASVASVFIGGGADSFSGSVEYGIAIGTEAVTTSDRSISIGCNIDNERFASVLIGNELFSDADNSVVVGKDITIDSVIFFKDPLLSPYTNAVQTDASLKLGASNIDYFDILQTPDGLTTYSTAAVAGYLTESLSNSSRLPINLLDADVGYDLLENAPDGAYAITHGLTTVGLGPKPTYAAAWASSVSASFALPAAVPSTPPATASDAYAESHGITVSLAPTACTVNVVALGSQSVQIPYFTPKRARIPRSLATVTGNVALPIESVGEQQALEPAWSYPVDVTAVDMPPAPSSTCNVVFEVAMPPTWGRLSNVGTNALYYELPLEAIFAESDAFAVRPVQVMRETVTGNNYGFKFAESNAYVVAQGDVRLFVPNVVPASNVIALDEELFLYAPRHIENELVRVQSIPSGAVWQTSDGSFTASDVSTMVAEDIDSFPDASNAIYYGLARDLALDAIAGLEGQARANVAPALASLSANVYSLSNADFVTELSWNTAVAGLDGLGTTEATRVAWATAASAGGQALFANASNAVFRLIEELAGGDALDVGGQVISIEDDVFSVFGIYPLSLNTRVLLQPVPVSAASERAFLLGATGTGASNAASAYDFWRHKFYDIPRTFPSIGQSALFGNALVGSSFDVKVGLAEAHSVAVATAQPVLHPNWELASNMTVPVSYEALSRPLPNLAVASVRVLVAPQYGELFSTTTNLSSFTYRVSHPFKSDDAKLLVTNTNGQAQTIDVQFARPTTGSGLYVRDIHAPWEPPQETRAWLGNAYEVTSDSRFALSNTFIVSGSRFHALPSAAGADDGHDEISLPSSNYALVNSYNAAVGLVTIHSNVQSFRIIASATENQSLGDVNLISPQYTFTYCNVLIDLDDVLTRSITVGETTPLAAYTLPVEDGVAPSNIFVTSNVILTRTEQHRRAFDAYVDTYAGTSNLISVSTRIRAEAVPRFVYTYGERIATTPVVQTYDVALATGRLDRAQIERSAYGTSNVEVFMSTAVVGTHHLAISSDSGTEIVGVAGVAGAAPWLMSNVGPVTSFAYESLANGLILAPVPNAAEAAPVYNVTYGDANSALATYGYNYNSTYASEVVANTSVTINPITYRALLLQGEVPPEGATHVHFLAASGGFVADTRVPVSASSVFVPDGVNAAHDMLWFYADASKNIVGGLRGNAVFVASAPHPLGQAINTRLSYAPTSILSPRAFAISQNVTFGGFREYVNGEVGESQADSWGLKTRAASPIFASSGVTVLLASAIDTWQIQVGSSERAWLRYIENGVTKHFLVSSYAKDDFPLISSASSSAWQIARLGNATVSEHVFTGAWWSDIARLYDGSLPVSVADIAIELAQPLEHAFFVDGSGYDKLQRFQLEDRATLRIIPLTPLGFRNEALQFRVMYGGRPSPVYALPLRPFWSIFPESGAEIYRSPSLVELGYTWRATLDDGALQLAADGLGTLVSDTRIVKSVPSSTSPIVSASAPLAITLDQADRYVLSAEELLGAVSYVPATSRELVFYMVQRPLFGVLMFVDGAPATRFVLSDVTSGRVVYQHLGSEEFSDALQLRVASGPFDVSAGNITFEFTLRALPLVLALAEANLYIANVADLALSRQFTSNQLAISDDGGYLHVLDADYIVSDVVYGGNSFEYSIDASILLGGAPYPALSFEFVVNASPDQHVNVLASVPAYAHLFRRTMRATLNKHVAAEAFSARPQPSARQGFEYEIDVNSEGARNFEGRSVGVYLEYATKQTLAYEDAAAAAQIARLQQLRYVLEGRDDEENVLFKLDVGKERVLYDGNESITVPSTLQPSFNAATFNTLYFVNNEAGNAAFYLDYNFEDSKAVNAARNIFAGATLPAVDFTRLHRVSFLTDLQDSSNIVTREFVGDVGAGTGLQASYSLSNYANTFELRNFEVLINTNALDTNSIAYDNNNYNVVLGSRISVRGVNNICIGSTFTTSGQKSIILGNNIGVTSSTAQLNDIYESIIIGSDSFANSFVRDVISIGKNNFNDLIDVDSERVAALLARKPILIGNDITNVMVDFHVNVGNTFLKTSQGSEQIYLGLGGETVGIGFSANVELAGDKLVVAGGTRTEHLTLANGGHIAHASELAPGATPVFGEVVRYSTTQKIAVCTQANDVLVAGVWGNGKLVTSGRTRIYVTGSVTAGDLLTSGADLAGTAVAQVLNTNRMSYTVAKALETVTTAVGARVLIECVL